MKSANETGSGSNALRVPRYVSQLPIAQIVAWITTSLVATCVAQMREPRHDSISGGVLIFLGSSLSFSIFFLCGMWARSNSLNRPGIANLIHIMACYASSAFGVVAMGAYAFPPFYNDPFSLVSLSLIWLVGGSFVYLVISQVGFLVEAIAPKARWTRVLFHLSIISGVVALGVCLVLRDRRSRQDERDAANSGTPTEKLWVLGRGADFRLRMKVAQNPATPPPLLREMAEVKELQYHVALNSRTPPDALIRLAEIDDNSVRGALAMNPSTPPEVLLELAKGRPINSRDLFSEETIRWRLEHNPSTPMGLKNDLAQIRILGESRLHNGGIPSSMRLP